MTVLVYAIRLNLCHRLLGFIDLRLYEFGNRSIQPFSVTAFLWVWNNQVYFLIITATTAIFDGFGGAASVLMGIKLNKAHIPCK